MKVFEAGDRVLRKDTYPGIPIGFGLHIKTESRLISESPRYGIISKVVTDFS